MSRLDAINDWVEKARLARYRAHELARLCSVSPSQSRRYFTTVFGKPPEKWLRELRAWQAVRLLHRGLCVKETACELAFASEAHFCRFFRKFHGCAPSEFIPRWWEQQAQQIERRKQQLGENFDSRLLPPPPWETAERNLCAKMRDKGNKCAL